MFLRMSSINMNEQKKRRKHHKLDDHGIDFRDILIDNILQCTNLSCVLIKKCEEEKKLII